MELVEISNKFLAAATFEELELPKPVYFVCRRELGGYCRQLSFNPQRRISAFQQNELRCQAPYVRMGCHRRITWLFEPSGSWNAESTRCLLISTMSSCRNKKKAYASITKKLLEKGKEIKQHKKTIKQMTGEGCDYVDEVCAASNQIHDLAGDS